jgi:cytoskeleton protein RodZ
METHIGEVLREARRRRQVEFAEVEEATRIRPRYLRAIEDEEWDALPGGVYTRGFIRTYASFLGLDGERLAEDYRENVEGASREWPPVQGPEPASGSASSRPHQSLGRRRIPAAGWLAVAVVLAIAAIVIVALPTEENGTGESGQSSKPGQTPSSAGAGGGHGQSVDRRSETPSGVSVRLAASAEVWVCVLDGKGRHLIDGKILEEGAEAGPFRSGSFTLSFGNGEVSMLIDGKEAEIPPTSSPIGYSIDSAGELTELSETERPTCT